MSEFIHAITSEIPERCRKCPVLLAHLALASDYENRASKIEESLKLVTDFNAITDPGEQPTAEHQLLSNLLEVATTSELRADNTVELLAMGTALCPGAKRGLPKEYRLIDRIQAYVANDQACQNPELMTILER